MTIGMLVTGSIIKPRIFISTSMPSLQHRSGRLIYGFADERIGACARDSHRYILAQQRVFIASREVERPVVRCAANPLAKRLMPPFHVYLFHGADQVGIAPNLNRPLPLVENDDTPGLF